MIVSPPASASASALAGMRDAQDRVDAAAHNIATANTAPFAPLRPDGSTDSTDTANLPTEMVAVATAPIVYTASAHIIRADEAMRTSLVDLFA